MQEEINKHTKKIYKAMKNQKHTLSEKVKEIIIEIFIIVFAVSLSIWLHSWSEHRHEQKEANKFLKELKEDLSADIKLLEENKNTATMLNNNYKFMLSLKKNKVNDSLIGPHTTFSLLGTSFNIGRYEGFKSSGKIGTIEDDKLKNKILSYYQQTIPNLISSVNFINAEQLKILDIDAGSLALYDVYTTQKMQSKYSNLQFNTNSLIAVYEEAIKQVNEIITESKTEK
ncbi:DUF6090 family protein [Flavobacterium sp. CF136]|uniref:DUF6090 family protein n=1 Tax=Flavobacterium sp. (strain CF136) TaxID=1144313 RepID=UPI00027152C4|nr:DUF6090 family protein [Flavobacterium sp. CF136]EJL61960.1 hypothetical protein PMI10_03052 [Flavobacterium sp. CF136]